MMSARQVIKISRAIGGAFLLLVQAACGDGASNPDTPRPKTNFAGYESQFSTLQSKWGGAGISDPAALPISGSATYSGVMRLSVETAGGPLRMDGAMTLTSNFTQNSVSGRVVGFVDEADNVLAGQLSITGGALDRAANTGVDYTYSANINGVLAAAADSFAIAGDISGDFRGGAQQATSGIASGTASSSFGTGYMFGDFIAKK